MLAVSCVLSFAALSQVGGSRLSLGQEDKPTGWAWKDQEDHAPPGYDHLAEPKGSHKHAWAGKEKSLKWKKHVPKAGSHEVDIDSHEVDIDKVPGAAVPRKVL